MQEDSGKNQNSLPTKMQLTIWVLVGAYLLYTVWTIKDSLSTHTGGELYVMIGFMALFTLAGAFLLIKGGHGLLTGRYVDGAMDTATEEDITEETQIEKDSGQEDPDQKESEDIDPGERKM